VTGPIENDETPKPVWDWRVYERFVPPTGYIRDYLEYACQCTDAPPLYHILSATAVVSAAIAPHLDLVFQNEVHPLHIFVLIIGNSSESRKTSAIKRAVKVAEPIFAKVSHRGERLWWPQVSSPEGIMEDLAKEPNRLVLLSEWTEIHRLASKGGYWQHAQEFWNLLYDATDAHRTRSKVKVMIQRPRVTVLGASTPGLVGHATTPIDWEGGKLARYLIGTMVRPPNMEMDAAVDHPNMVAMLRGRLDTLVQPRAPGTGANATLSPDAWSLMRSWQKSQWWRDFKNRAPQHLAPSCARAPEHVFRVAGVFQCSMSYPFKVEVSAEAMSAAIQLVEWCYEDSFKCFALVHDEDMTPLAKVQAALAAAGGQGMLRGALLRKTKVTAKQLNEALGTLVERGEMKAGNTWVTGKAHPSYTYVAPTGD
jgi:hypothetical protein